MPEPHNPLTSTGRGGAGNIGEDPNVYVEGDIVREGTPGTTGRSGRGGAGNTSGIATPPNRSSEDIIPEPAMRSRQDDFHTGRGGQGNIHKDKYGGHSKPQEKGHEGLMEKAKHALGLDGHKHEGAKRQETES